MRQLLFYIVCTLFLFGCEANNHPKKSEVIRENTSSEQEKVENEAWKMVPIKAVDDEAFVSVKSLVDITNGKANFDKINKTLLLFIGNHQYSFIHTVPVFERNGLFLPGDENDFQIIDDQAWLSMDFIHNALELKVKRENDQALINIPAALKQDANNEVSKLSELGSIENIIDIMSVLESPIKGAKVDTIPSHLPGAKRVYRNGVHEGMDWYGFSTGVPMNRETEVYAMADGIIVRADHEYKKYKSEEERNADLKIASETGFTPVYILDRLRGRQVWVQYDNGLQARFAHLDSISESLQVGDAVTSETLIGHVGNSGTSGDVKGNQSELHLHLDLLYRGELFWKGLSEKEIETVLKTVFIKQKG